MITVTDLFCGAGGSSVGAEAAGGTLVMAANHWQTAIDVHQSHFPNAAHDTADISQADPRRYPVSDILLASPECTNHSQARGISRKRQDPELWDAPDPSAERSRATMWDVVRFAEQIHYAAIVVENVVEATKWVLWPSWWQAMVSLGYQGRVLSHNSMHHGVPQSRDRIYVVWTRNGLRPNLEMETSALCTRCDQVTIARQAFKRDRHVGRYRAQWVWSCTRCHHPVEPSTTAAATIIDWALDCPRIGSRPRQLAPATRDRILAGLQRYGWAPILHQTAHGGRSTPLTAPHPAVCASDDRQALVLSNNFGLVPQPVADPLSTVTTGNRHGLVLTNNGFDTGGRRTKPTDEPLTTVVADGNQHALIVPLRRNGHASSIGEVAPTVTAGGNHHGLLMRNMTPRGDSGQMCTPVSEPARTFTTTSPQSLLMPYYGNGQAQPVDRPMPTVDDCGFRMLAPYEVAAAMAFPVDYIPRSLRKKDQVKLAGNAVTPPVMRAIVGRIIQAMERAA